ncbi:MAG: hypothetical protein JNJ65_04405 [Cyclobacteriaceae bacterium]|nr:hypothetical protein [Cyclobacteriaceae bacterium]
MRKLLTGVICFFILFSSTEISFAQFNRNSIKKKNKRIASYRGKKSGFGKNKIYNAVGLSLGALNYYGDIAPTPSTFSSDISFTRPAVALSFAHRFGPRYTLVGQFMYGTLKGSDVETASQGDQDNGVYRYQRNLTFRNQIKELSVMAYFDLFENDATYISRVKWTPYAFIGVAGFTNNPQAQAPAAGLNGEALGVAAGEWIDLRPLGTEGQFSTLDPTDANVGIDAYSKLQIGIPFGVGARFRINEVMDLWADWGFRYTFTDYLDDVSQNYVDLGVFGTNNLARAMSYRSNELPASELPPLQSYVARNGQTYSTIPGYGREHPDNVRGSKGDRDIYMVTTVRLTYILGATFHKAKFR